MIQNRRTDVGLLWGGLLILLGLVLLAQSTGLVPGAAEAWFGTGILAAIGLGFLALYLVAPVRWWALIPSGVMLSLALVAGIDPYLPGGVSGAIFLFGLAATFGVVAVAPSPCPPRTWAWIPATVLAVLGAITLGSIAAAAVFWPLVLIAIGAWLVALWALRQRRTGG
jgi:hypothetical protein